MKLAGVAVTAVLWSIWAAEPVRERHFAVDYTVSVDKIPTLADTVEIWVPVPHNDAFQSITKLDVEADYSRKIQTGEFGNHILHMRLAGKTVGPSLMFSVRFAVRRRARAGGDGAAAGPNLEHWLEAGSHSPALLEGLEAISGNNLEKARSIYQRATSRGNCVESNSAFIANLRAQGIPARLSLGLALPGARGQGTVRGDRCWSEIFIEGSGWLPVDLSAGAKFGELDQNVVELSRGQNLALTPRQRGGPVDYLLYPYVEVNGKPFAGVKASFHYADMGKPKN